VKVAALGAFGAGVFGILLVAGTVIELIRMVEKGSEEWL
jgi:hypothetical protein